MYWSQFIYHQQCIYLGWGYIHDVYTMSCMGLNTRCLHDIVYITSPARHGYIHDLVHEDVYITSLVGWGYIHDQDRVSFQYSVFLKCTLMAKPLRNGKRNVKLVVKKLSSFSSRLSVIWNWKNTIVTPFYKNKGDNMDQTALLQTAAMSMKYKRALHGAWANQFSVGAFYVSKYIIIRKMFVEF